MDGPSLLETARQARGLSQAAVARRAGTSQPTLSAYERGLKSPTIAVVRRILHTLGFDLGLVPRVTFREVIGERGRYVVPDQLWRVEPPACFAPADVSDPEGQRRTADLLNRESRVDAYAWLLTHGDEELIFGHVDGALLVEAWAGVSPRLPPELRRAWLPLIQDAGLGWLAAERAKWYKEPAKPLSRAARERLIHRLADLGLTPDEIRAVLKRRR